MDIASPQFISISRIMSISCAKPGAVALKVPNLELQSLEPDYHGALGCILV